MSKRSVSMISISMSISMLLVLVAAGAGFAGGGGGCGVKAPPPGGGAVQRMLGAALPVVGEAPPGVSIAANAGWVRGRFLLGGRTARAGIEVRIAGDLAGVTDAQGRFRLPPGTPSNVELQFAVDGTVFHTRRGALAERSVEPFGGGMGGGAGSGAGEMYGVAYDDQGGIPGALVIVTDGEEYAFDVANSEGVYAIQGAPTGSVVVIAMAEFHRAAVHVVDLAPGEPLEFHIFLERIEGLGKLFGQAAVPGGGPVAGVYVRFSEPGGSVREDLTNLYGVYELLDIPAGVGHLFAHKDGFHDFHLDTGVLPGENRQDIAMVPVDLGAVIGQVTLPDETPVPGALVRLTYPKLDGGYGWMFAYSGDEGEFGFGAVPPGSYLVQSFAPGWAPGAAVGTVFEGQVAVEHLVMEPTDVTGTLEGWAVDFDGNPVPYAFGYVSYIGFEEVSGWVVADGNGHFVVPGIPFGAYAVRIESAAFLPDWEFSDILPSEEQDFLAILYPFDPDLAGALGGTVTDAAGDPVPYAVVGCAVLGHEEVSYKTLTGAEGQYLFPFLPPAAYGVFAIQGEVGSAAATAEVTTGEQTVLDLVLE